MADSTPQQHSAWRTYRRLLGYVGQFSGAFVIAVAGFILYALTQSAFASLMQYLPSAFETNPNVSGLAQWELQLGLNTREGIRVFLPLAII